MAAVDERPIGFGRLKREEDARFIRGQGTFVDDLQLPGMLHGAILRSPVAHARIVSIDASAALQHPKVHAAITGQEVAFVIADDHYSARDALELIDVEYDPFAVVIDARRALAGRAPMIRDDKPGQSDNHIFAWESGDQTACEKVP